MADSYEGFSIRGYVSKMRGVDARKCWPFSRAEEEDELQQKEVEKLLPPMECRQAVWWMHELERERAAEGEELAGPVGEAAVGEEGAMGIREAEEAAEVEVEREQAGLKVCPVCERFTASTINAVNAHIDGCLAEAAPNVERQQRRGRRGKSRAPKKRSLVELFSVSLPVVSAGDNNGDEEQQEEEESQAQQEEEVEITKKRKNNNNLNQTTRKKMKKGLIKGQTRKHKVPSCYNYSKLLRSTSLGGRQRYKVVPSIILQKRKQSRLRLRPTKNQLKVRTSQLIAKLHKEASVPKRKRKSTTDLKPAANPTSDGTKRSKISQVKHVNFLGKDDIIEVTRKPCSSLESPATQTTDEAASPVVDQPMESSAQVFLTDKFHEVYGRLKDLGSVTLRLERTVDLNQDIQDTDDVQMLTTGASTASDIASVSGVPEMRNLLHPEEGTLPEMVIQTERSVQREHSSDETPTLSFADLRNSSEMASRHDYPGTSASIHQNGVEASRQHPLFLETVKHSMDPYLLQYPHLLYLHPNCSASSSRSSMETKRQLAQKHGQSGEAINNLQPLPACRERVLNEGFVGLPLNSQGELIHFRPDGMAGLNPVHKKQRETRQFERFPFYSSAGSSNGIQFPAGKATVLSDTVLAGLVALGLRSAERTGNECQEQEMLATPAGRLGMQRVPGRDSSKSVFRPVNQQTVRLMGKNVTVGKLDDGQPWRGNNSTTDGSSPVANFFENPMPSHSFLQPVQDASKDRESYLKEAANSKKLPRIVPVRSVEASSSFGGLNPGPHLTARRNHCSEAQQLVPQFPFNLPQGFVPGNYAGRLSMHSYDQTQSSAECLPKWLLDATMQKKSINSSAPAAPRPPISVQSPQPRLSTLPSASLQWPKPALRKDGSMWSRSGSSSGVKSKSVSFKDADLLKTPSKRLADKSHDSAGPPRIANLASGPDLKVGLGQLGSGPRRDQMDGPRIVPDLGSKSDSVARSGPLKLTAGARHILKPSPNVDQENPRPIHSTIPFNGVAASRKFHSRPSKVIKL